MTQSVPNTSADARRLTLSDGAGGLDAALTDEARQAVEALLPAFLDRQRWFSGRNRGEGATELRVLGVPAPADGRHLLTETVTRTAAGEQRYLLPLSTRFDAGHGGAEAADLPHVLTTVDQGLRPGALIDGTRDPAFAAIVVGLIADGQDVELGAARLVTTVSPTAAEVLQQARAVTPDRIRVISGEQSNTSILVGDVAVLKFYRQLRDGIQPELEVTRFLTDHTDFTGTPALYGSMDLVRPDGTRAAAVALFKLAPNQGDAWSVVTTGLASALKDGRPTDTALGTVVGRRTGEMHAALATRTGDADFDPEPVDAAALQHFVAGAKASAAESLGVLAGIRGGGASMAPEIDRLLSAESAVMAWFDGFNRTPIASHRTRIHGDYHLGQLLVAGEDVVILDFEGEPGAPLEERREKSSPLRDVAGMLRSFDYAAFAALDTVPGADAAMHAQASAWRDAVSTEFLGAWSQASGLALDEGAARLLDLFTLQKAFYELKYEAASRPAWLSIPLRGIISLLEKRQVL